MVLADAASGASPVVAAAAASHLAGVILFTLKPRGSLYVYVLASERLSGCKRSTMTTLLAGTSEFPVSR